MALVNRGCSATRNSLECAFNRIVSYRSVIKFRVFPPATLALRVGACAALFLAVSVFGQSGAGGEVPPEQIAFFESKIRPVLSEHCYECHSSQAKKLKAGLYLDHRDRAMKGGESGAAFVPGNPDASLLLRALRFQEESLEMPPKGKLPGRVIADFEKWIQLGAPWPTDNDTAIAETQTGYDWEKFRREHWSFKPVVKPPPPATPESDWPQNEIDRFVLAKLDAANIRPLPQANRRTLIRRAYFDLIGLPPTQAEVAAFIDGKISWDDVINRLLASPHYGERWARHWLDVARYSDGLGGFLDSGNLPEAWRYRDWVVESLNRDLPYDDFVRQQIAGDNQPGIEHAAIGVGFFAVGPTYRSDGGDPEAIAQAKAETLSDRVDTFSRAFLGLTVACARCHDHKFDPITARDYYAIAGVFNNTSVREYPLAPADVVATYQKQQKAINDLQGKIRKLDADARKAKRKLTDTEKSQKAAWNAEMKQRKTELPPKYPFAHVLGDSGSKDMPLAIRGDLRKKGPMVERRFLQIVAGEDAPRFRKGSGREELAEAVVDRANPLTARVMVNRVWQWHFGRALARTPSNFGILGEKPTHPELLDWLAATFVEEGWSLKRLHRSIMTSAAYRMSSAYNEANFARDGDNRLLWRMNPRRLDVESWRDSLLAVSGGLNRRIGGPPVGEILESPRRTLYSTVSRNGDRFRSDDFLRTFDFPAARSSSAGRATSIVPQQYLFMLNSKFMSQRARELAARMRDATANDEERIALAYLWLFQRSPDAVETEIGAAFLKGAGDSSARLEQYAQSLLSSEEFRYVE